jgi:hypothetical protein
MKPQHIRNVIAIRHNLIFEWQRLKHAVQIMATDKAEFLNSLLSYSVLIMEVMLYVESLAYMEKKQQLSITDSSMPALARYLREKISDQQNIHDMWLLLGKLFVLNELFQQQQIELSDESYFFYLTNIKLFVCFVYSCHVDQLLVANQVVQLLQENKLIKEMTIQPTDFETDQEFIEHYLHHLSEESDIILSAMELVLVKRISITEKQLATLAEMHIGAKQMLDNSDNFIGLSLLTQDMPSSERDHLLATFIRITDRLNLYCFEKQGRSFCDLVFRFENKIDKGLSISPKAKDMRSCEFFFHHSSGLSTDLSGCISHHHLSILSAKHIDHAFSQGIPTNKIRVLLAYIEFFDRVKKEGLPISALLNVRPSWRRSGTGSIEAYVSLVENIQKSYFNGSVETHLTDVILSCDEFKKIQLDLKEENDWIENYFAILSDGGSSKINYHMKFGNIWQLALFMNVAERDAPSGLIAEARNRYRVRWEAFIFQLQSTLTIESRWILDAIAIHKLLSELLNNGTQLKIKTEEIQQLPTPKAIDGEMSAQALLTHVTGTQEQRERQRLMLNCNFLLDCRVHMLNLLQSLAIRSQVEELYCPSTLRECYVNLALTCLKERCQITGEEFMPNFALGKGETVQHEGKFAG